jgi:hypothetical protein
MKKLVALACMISACAWTLGATAQSAPLPPEPDVVNEQGAAGAAERPSGEETFLPGPGGGEIEQPGLPPLESTGLEDGIGSGCKCSAAVGARRDAASLSLVFGLALLLVTRRTRNQSADPK